MMSTKNTPASDEKKAEITPERVSASTTKCAELVEMCKAKGLKQSGKKEELVKRLLDALSSEAKPSSTDEKKVEKVVEEKKVDDLPPTPVEEEKRDDITQSSILSATRDQLVAMCKSKGLVRSGKKDELLTRLLDSISAPKPASLSTPVVSSKKSTKPKEDPPVLKAIKGSPMIILKNKFGNFEHVQTGIVFNKDKKAYGRQSKEGSIIDLTPEDIDTCRQHGFPFVPPKTFKTSDLSKTVEEDDDDDDDDEEEEQEEEEEEDEKDDE